MFDFELTVERISSMLLSGLAGLGQSKHLVMFDWELNYNTVGIIFFMKFFWVWRNSNNYTGQTTMETYKSIHHTDEF